MGYSSRIVGRLLPVVLLALAVGCQQQTRSTEAEALDPASAADPTAGEAKAGDAEVVVNTPEEVVAQQSATLAEPQILFAPTQSEVAADQQPREVIVHHDLSTSGERVASRQAETSSQGKSSVK